MSLFILIQLVIGIKYIKLCQFWQHKTFVGPLYQKFVSTASCSNFKLYVIGSL